MAGAFAKVSSANGVRWQQSPHYPVMVKGKHRSILKLGGVFFFPSCLFDSQSKPLLLGRVGRGFLFFVVLFCSYR